MGTNTLRAFMIHSISCAKIKRHFDIQNSSLRDVPGKYSTQSTRVFQAKIVEKWCVRTVVLNCENNDASKFEARLEYELRTTDSELDITEP